MKRKTNIAALVLITLAAAAQAQQARMETPMSTGPGGFTLTVSTPPGDGPYDFAKNKGPKINTIAGNTYGEVLFGGNVSNSPTGVLNYMVSVYRDDKAIERGKPYTAEKIALDIIKHEGFVGRAAPFNCPANNIDAKNEMVCYRMAGTSVFDNKPMNELRSAVTVVAVSLKNNTMGYAFIGLAIEKNVQLFDKDPSQTIKNADGAAAGMFRNSRFTLN